MPTITNETIHALYELYGNDDYPVDQYCIGCENCEVCGFPCANCAAYVFNGQLGEGTILPIVDINNVINNIIDNINDDDDDDDDIISPGTPMDIDEIPLDLMHTSSDDLDSLENTQEEIELVRSLISDPNISRHASE
jgi:hypothetical protein